MAYPGPFCEKAGITENLILDGTLPSISCICNGLALELKQYTDSKNFTYKQYVEILRQLDQDFNTVNNHTSVISRLNYIKEQKKKLIHRKKVSGCKNVDDLMNQRFVPPVKRGQSGFTTRNVSDSKVVKSVSNQEAEIQQLSSLTLTKEIQTETDSDVNSDMKNLNLLKYRIKISEGKVNTLSKQISEQKENLDHIMSEKGHFCKKNVNKRDENARKNLHRLRDAQRTILRLQKQIKTHQSTEDEMKNLKIVNSDLNDKLNIVSESYENERSKKLTLQKANSYLRNEINSLRAYIKDNNNLPSTVTDNEKLDNYKKLKLELTEKDAIILELQEEMKENKTIQTKTSKGAYCDNIRLCIIELAGLEVSAEKMSPVIQCVTKHISNINLKKQDLPNPTTCQTIVDEGHFIAKAFIADKLEKSQKWGLGRDGTSRRKHKILDTAVTLDSGDIISLGFTRVARETAETIQMVTEEHMNELATIKDSTNYLSDTLSKLAFTISDRASNEKLANTFLDEWVKEMLDSYEGEKNEVHHFYCMAHVLLGLHNYVNPELKELLHVLKDKTGPLGRDTLSIFNSWSRKENVASRVIRTTSDIFGPRGEHIGVRDRWESYCLQNGLKSIIGNYKDNRFNAIFQTAAEICVHRCDFLKVLDTVSKPNLKITAVKSDLESEEINTIIQCLGLFYYKLTGPYWNLLVSGKVPYYDLYKHVMEIADFLKKCKNNPQYILKPDEHWCSTDPHSVKIIPHRELVQESLFIVNKDCEDIFNQIIPCIAGAMLKCVHKQLEDFFPGGKFYNVSSAKTKDLKFAPTTNLGCEHHFGDLDSSQRRRPNASYHHHSSVQMLKRNRTQIMEWLFVMDTDKRDTILTSARKGGKHFRLKHKNHDLNVLKNIGDEMLSENNRKRKRGSNKVSTKNRQTETKIENLSLNTYVVVAYQDAWYPGFVQELLSEGNAVIKFMTPCDKKGHFKWPSRDDIQTVNSKFVLCQNFLPECQNSGRQWLIKEYKDIDKAYLEFTAIYF